MPSRHGLSCDKTRRFFFERPMCWIPFSQEGWGTCLDFGFKFLVNLNRPFIFLPSLAFAVRQYISSKGAKSWLIENLEYKQFLSRLLISSFPQQISPYGRRWWWGSSSSSSSLLSSIITKKELIIYDLRSQEFVHLGCEVGAS